MAAATSNAPQPGIRFHGTVQPYAGFNAPADAEAIFKAVSLKGNRPDEQAAVNLLCNRSAAQRMQIVQAFKAAYDADLKDTFKADFKGNFGHLMHALLYDRPHFLACSLHNALKGHFAQPLTVVTPGFDPQVVSAEDAHQITGEGVCEDALSEIILTQPSDELQQLKAAYSEMYQADLEREIEGSSISDDLRTKLLSALRGDNSQRISNLPAFFAERLHKALLDVSRHDTALIRIIVTRSEIDLYEIGLAFESQYKQPLQEVITHKCSGHYRQGLLTLMGAFA